MCLQIPWTNLGKSAVVVYIDRLYILAGPKTEAASAEDGTYEVSSSPAAPIMTQWASCAGLRVVFSMLARNSSSCGLRRRKPWKGRPSDTESTAQSWHLCGCVWPESSAPSLDYIVHLLNLFAVPWHLTEYPPCVVRTHSTLRYTRWPFGMLLVCTGKG